MTEGPEDHQIERRATRTRPSTRLIGTETDFAADSIQSDVAGLRAPDVLFGEALAHPPQQDRSRRSREALIAAAFSLFAEHGYEATTVDDIAKKAGVAVGGFYLHFRSKRQVLLVLVDRLLNEIDITTEVAPDDPAAIIECLRDRLRASWSYGRVYRAWREATLRDRALAALHEQVEAWATAQVERALSVAMAAPAARSDVSLPNLSYIVSTIFWRQLELETVDRESLSRTVATLLQHVLFEDRAASPRDDDPRASREE